MKTRLERFREKVAVNLETGCWEWIGGIDRYGYGKFLHGKAHRWSYEQENGPIPAGMEPDHICRVRHCVRPDHLEPVTRAENMQRSPLCWVLRSKESGLRLRPEVTHCRNGHFYDEANTRIDKNGYRHCQNCARLRYLPKP